MTHVNAYYADVADAEAKVALAEGELEAAKQRLAAKEAEDGPGESATEEEAPAEAEPDKKAKKSHEVVAPPVEPLVEESAADAGPVEDK